MPKEIEGIYQDVTLPTDEINALKAIEELLQANGFQPNCEAIPVLEGHTAERCVRSIGCSVKDGSVVALSMRYCSLAVLPDVLSQFTNLRHLDVTGNQLTALPERLASLSSLRTLFLDD